MKSILMNKQEERVVNFLIIYAFSEGRVGLLKGRTGIAIAFYLLGGKKNSDVYSVFGEKLLQSVLSGLTGGLSNSFATGLCGIGWGIEYLFRQNFIMCSSNTFENLDYRIMNTNLAEMNFSLEEGLEGMLHYVLIHLYNCNLRKETQPFTPSFLENLYQQIKFVSDRTSLPARMKLLMEQYSCWYETGKLQYDFGLKDFIEKNIKCSENLFQEKVLSLHNGLAGYIVNKMS